MGNYKFRFSDMLPNAWFYKLKDMSKVRNLKKTKSTPSSVSSSKITEQSNLSDQRKSYHFTREITDFNQNSPIKAKLVISDKNPHPEPPRKSARRRRSTRRNRQPANRVVLSCSCRTTLESVWTKPPDNSPVDQFDQTNYSSSDHDSMLREYSSDEMRSNTSSCDQCNLQQNDIVMDKFLPPIITKKQGVPTNFKVHAKDHNFIKNGEHVKSPIRRFPMNSPGVRIRTNTPRIANRRINTQGGGLRKSVWSSKRSVSESFAVVKSSKDPRRDFMESMVEMIVENNLRAAKDLEELLACYLLLNSDEYHDLIVNVFRQIWFDFVHVSLK